jgi:hypothetical protein
MNEESNEWTRYQVHLPADDYDEDDELDARITAAEKKQREHVNRGGFFGI